MRLPKLLDISGYFFGVNILLSNLMRIPVLGPILRIPVGILWLIGFGTWYLGSRFEGKPHPHQTEGWYTFAEFKVQNEISALFGTIAAILLLIAPALVVPIAWLFLISNVFWAIAAHHESDVLHTDDADYSTDKQIVYSYLTFAVTALSLITALGATITLFLPVAAPAILPILTVIGVGLACLSIGIGIKWCFGPYEADKSKRERRQTNTDAPEIAPDLDLNDTPEESCWSNCCPLFFGSPIHSEKKPPTDEPAPSLATPLAR